MTDPRLPRDEPAGDGELLSAYLDGELDGAARAEVEARLERDPEFAARLEGTRAVVEALASLRAAPPPGYHERLVARIAAERAGAGLDPATSRAAADRVPAGRVPAGRVAGTVGTAPRGASAATGPGRARSRRRWAPALSVAAGVMVLALLGGVAVLGGVRGLGQSEDSVAEAPMFDAEEDDGARMFADEAPELESLAEDDVADEPEEALDEDDHEAAVSAPASGQPLLIDEGTVLDDGDAALQHFADRAATVDVRGMDTGEAEETALAFRVAIQRAPPFSTGIGPDHCLDQVTAGADGPAVPVLVERVTFEGRDSLAYLVATASRGSDTLDRLEGWVLDAGACATRLFTPITP